MNAILGLVVTLVLVFGGYLLSGGKMHIITHALPFEGMMIGGAALGSFLAANDMNTIKHALGDMGSVFSGAKWKKTEREWVDGYLKFHGRIERDDWVKQAKALAKGGEAEYVRVFGKKPR